LQIENAPHAVGEFGAAFTQPDSVKMAAKKILVEQIESGSFDLSMNHPDRIGEKVLIMGALGGAIGEDESGLTATAGASASLGVVGGSRRDISHIYSVESGDIYAEFHRRRAEEDRQVGSPETLFPLFSDFGIDLSGVLSAFEAKESVGVGCEGVG
jgi:hypothetical protein